MWQSFLSPTLRSPLCALSFLLAPSWLTWPPGRLFSSLSNWTCFSLALNCQSVTRKLGVRCGHQTTRRLRLQLARHQVPSSPRTGCLVALILAWASAPLLPSWSCPPHSFCFLTMLTFVWLQLALDSLVFTFTSGSTCSQSLGICLWCYFCHCGFPKKRVQVPRENLIYIVPLCMLVQVMVLRLSKSDPCLWLSHLTTAAWR